MSREPECPLQTFDVMEAAKVSIMPRVYTIEHNSMRRDQEPHPCLPRVRSDIQHAERPIQWDRHPFRYKLKLPHSTQSDIDVTRLYGGTSPPYNTFENKHNARPKEEQWTEQYRGETVAVVFWVQEGGFQLGGCKQGNGGKAE